MLPPNPGALFPPPAGPNNFMPPTQFFTGTMMPTLPGPQYGGLPPMMGGSQLGGGYPATIPNMSGGMYAPQEEKKDTLKKLFVKNVNELIPDVVIEKILREFGELKY